MDFYHAIFLGAIQGLTEFLPISSSGHLVFFQNLLGYKKPLIAFDVVVHLGTLLAIVTYFAKDVFGMAKEGIGFLFDFPKVKSSGNWNAYFHEHTHALTLGYALLTTTVTVIIVLIFKDTVYAIFSSVEVVGVAWLVMGCLLLASRKIQQGSRDFYQMSHRDAFVIGVAQGFAVIPGISRSGTTIMMGMACGLERKVAARFSFFIGLIAIAAAGILELESGVEFFNEASAALIVGFLTSAVVGYLAIFLLMKLLEKGKFFIFGFYCLGMGLLTLALSLLDKI